MWSKKNRQELTPNVFVRNHLVERKIKNCRKLGLDINSVTCDEQNIINTLQIVFEREIILTQYCIENKRIDTYFSK